jgi:ClpP class serine protease
MGVFRNYLVSNLSNQAVETERRAQLKRIGDLRNSAVISYAARTTFAPIQLPTAILYDDLLPFRDALEGLTGPRVSVLLETHGGVGEVGREMVELLHERFEHVTFIVPGTAKSTGTIMVLGGDEILMGSTSSLGPIDAQIVQEGKQ